MDEKQPLPESNTNSGDDDIRVLNLTRDLESLVNDASSISSMRETLRARLLKVTMALVPALETPPDVVQRVTYSTLEAMAARIGCQIGLFTRLVETKQPLSTEELALPIGADITLLERLLKFISSFHMIMENDINLWSPSNLTYILADRGMEGAVFTNFKTLGPAWLALPRYLQRTRYQKPTDTADTAFSQGHGVNMDVFQWYREHPENEKEFGLFMQAQRFGDGSWLDSFPFANAVVDGAGSEEPIFVDVGGGIGHQCQRLLSAMPSLKGRVILQDQESVIKNSIAIEGMEMQAVDFLQHQPVKGARAYYLRSILHDWNDNFCRIILRHIREAMGPKSLLLLDELVIPMKNAHRIAMLIDITMMASCASEERSVKRWKDLLASERFEVTDLHTYHEEVGHSIITAVPV